MWNMASQLPFLFFLRLSVSVHGQACTIRTFVYVKALRSILEVGSSEVPMEAHTYTGKHKKNKFDDDRYLLR